MTRPVVRSRVFVVFGITMLLFAAGVGSASALLGVPTPPEQPQAGLPGGNGSCGEAVRSVANPRPGATLPVWIFEPTGTPTAPLTGGRRNDSDRPAALVAHGFCATDPATHQALLDHVVSVGNVVVYAAYDAVDHDGDGDTDRSDLEESYRVVDDGIVAAVATTPRIDLARVGWWGHSHGGGMVPWLVQQGASRGWGTKAVWMSNVAQAYSQLIGDTTIAVPANTQAMTVAFAQDAF